MVNKIKWVVMVSIMFVIISCYYDKEALLYPGENNCSGTDKKFSTDVHPVIQSKCSYASDCHGTGSTNSGGLLTNYSQIKNSVLNIRNQIVIGSMPKNGSLTNAELQTILCWIDSGSPFN